jgi:hypothetical protein
VKGQQVAGRVGQELGCLGEALLELLDHALGGRGHPAQQVADELGPASRP